MTKRFVLDTSVLLSDVDVFEHFEDNHIILPSIVLEELNQFKEELSDRGYTSRMIIQFLENLSEKGSLKKGICYKKTRIQTSYEVDNEIAKQTFQMKKNDYFIIACAKYHDAILVTNDKMMRLFARDFVQTEEYKANQVKVKEWYKGYRQIKTDNETIEKLYQEGLYNVYGCYPNEFVIFIDSCNPQRTGVGICKENRILSIDKRTDLLSLETKTKPLNLEQKMMMHLLLDEDISCVTITGMSGKGKSLLPIDVGLQMVFQQIYDHFIYTKSVIPMDKKEELGFYKGEMSEKFRPHLEPFYSSIEILYREELYQKEKRKSVDDKVMELTESDQLRFLPLAHIRGMSIFNKFVMLDEAQNTTPHTMKSFITRMHDSSKAVIVGDIEQIDDRHLNAYNNGLSHLIEAGKEEPFIGHITLDISKEKSQRGKLAAFGSKKL